MHCDMCEYAATTSSHLKGNKVQGKEHEGFRYPCDLCEYAATISSNLKRHKEVKRATPVTCVNMQLQHY